MAYTSSPTTRPATVAGSRVGVVGGSIAGCAAAIALGRLGCEVTILERSSEGLRDRGSGIAIPIALRDELIAAGYLQPEYPAFRPVGRSFWVADGSYRGDRRWFQPGAAVTNNWGVLWRALRANASDAQYVDGAVVTSVVDGVDGVRVELGSGEQLHFDVVIGADGYRSILRSLLHPESTPNYAGYILWRGNFPASELTDTEAWDEVLETGEWITVGFDGGHAVMYPIPDFDSPDGSDLRVNWAIYASTPDGLVIDGPSSIAPGQVDGGLYSQLQHLLDTTIPPRQRPLFASPRHEVSIQPIYDECVDSYTSGNVALIGDAATLSRPHTGSGATKAMEDARLLETLGATHQTWHELFAAYDADRAPHGASLVELGRRIGRDQVEHTPPWHTMTPSDFDAWTAGTLGDDSLYFWADD